MKKQLYPGAEGIAEYYNQFYREHDSYVLKHRDEKPDFIGGKPNYDKFRKWSAEEVLVWLNID